MHVQGRAFANFLNQEFFWFPLNTSPASTDAQGYQSLSGNSYQNVSSFSALFNKFHSLECFCFDIKEIAMLAHFCFPGREKNAKICKISGEKLVFWPQISYIILRWNAVNAVKLCKFTARLSGDLTKIHHNSPLKYVISPPLQGYEPLTSCTSSTSSSTAPSLTKFYYFCLNINRIHYFLQNMRGEFL